MDNDNLIEVGTYDKEFNKIMGLNLPTIKIYQSNGLETHMIKHKHSNCIKYLGKIPEILDKPDYIGKNPKEENSIELIKKYEDNILIAIKLDKNGDYLYIATMHEVAEPKLIRRLNSGRVKAYEKVDNLDYLM